MRAFPSLALVLLFCLSGIARADEEADRKAVHAFLEEYRRAANERDTTATRAQFDVEAAMEYFEREGVFLAFPAGKRAAAREKIRISLGEMIGAELLLPPFESFQIRSIGAGAAPGTLVAHVRIHDADGLFLKARLYLRRRGEGLRLYDLEDLDSGAGVIATMGTILVEAARGGVRRETMQSWARLDEAISQVDPADFEQIHKFLTEAEALELPDILQLMVQIELARVSLDMGDYLECLSHADQAVELKADVPVLHYFRAVACNQLDRPSEALGQAQAYIAALGEDPEVNLELGMALYSLGRKPEAVAILRKALASPAVDFEALAYLALSLPAPAHGEIEPLFARLESVLADFYAMAEICIDEESPAVLRLFSSLLAKRSPGHYYLPFYTGRAAVLEQDHAKAAPLFERAWRQCEAQEKDPAIRSGCVEWYLYAMAEQGKHLVAFEQAPDRPVAFRYLAERLATEEEPEVLMDLIARAGTEEEVLLERRFYTGQVHFLRKHYKDAIAVLRPLHEELGRKAQEDEDLLESLWGLEDSLLRSLVRAKEPGLDEALVLAKAIAARDEDWDYVVVVLAHKGDVTGTLAALEKAIHDEEDAKRLFENEDLKDLLAGEAYQAVHKKYLPKR